MGDLDALVASEVKVTRTSGATTEGGGGGSRKDLNNRRRNMISPPTALVLRPQVHFLIGRVGAHIQVQPGNEARF